MKKILLVSAVLLLTSSAVHAAKVHMKDGTVIEGKILSRDNDSIAIQPAAGFPQKLFKSEINIIEEDVKPTEYKEGIPLMSDLKPAQADLIRNVLKAAGVYSTLKANLENVIKSAPENKKTDFLIALNADELFERLIPIYAKYYTTEELKALLSFYESPAGRKFLEVTPLVVGDTMTVSMEYFKEKLEPIE